MNDRLRNIAVLAVLAAGTLPTALAQAQYYGGNYAQPAPLYPYAVQNSYGVQVEPPYAVEVAPNTYEIRRTAAPARAYPDMRDRAGYPALEQNAPGFDPRHRRAARAVIDELRKRSPVKRTVINTKKIVYDPPVVIETKRVVNDPPRVIVRYHWRPTGAFAPQACVANATRFRHVHLRRRSREAAQLICL